MSAIIFPGQGSQFLKMSMDFNDNFIISREIFDEIENTVKINIRDIILENTDNKLNQTNYTQIAIFSASMVIYKTLLNEIGLDKINPEIVLGHSLGEYSALVANNTLSLKDASNLIQIRGALMNSAITPNTSSMAAIIGKNAEFIENIINKNKLNIEVANDNSPMQVVISGMLEDIKKSEDIFLSAGIKRFVKLNVSSAFHSKYMLDAQNKLNIEIDKIIFTSTKIPIISNFNSQINLELEEIIMALKKQMVNRVNWTDSIKKLEETNISKIIEIGPGKVLSGLVSRISSKFEIISVNKIEDLKKFNN